MSDNICYRKVGREITILGSIEKNYKFENALEIILQSNKPF